MVKAKFYTALIAGVIGFFVVLNLVNDAPPPPETNKYCVIKFGVMNESHYFEVDNVKVKIEEYAE